MTPVDLLRIVLATVREETGRFCLECQATAPNESAAPSWGWTRRRDDFVTSYGLLQFRIA
jgi:hypothetical protein